MSDIDARMQAMLAIEKLDDITAEMSMSRAWTGADDPDADLLERVADAVVLVEELQAAVGESHVDVELAQREFEAAVKIATDGGER